MWFRNEQFRNLPFAQEELSQNLVSSAGTVRATHTKTSRARQQGSLLEIPLPVRKSLAEGVCELVCAGEVMRTRRATETEIQRL